MKRERTVKRALITLLCALLSMTLMVAMLGCFPKKDEPKDEPVKEETDSGTGSVSRNTSSDPLSANTVDTSSKYTFAVQGAFVGMDKYSDTPVVIMIGEFTNNSDETISYASALDVTATQSGHKLSTSYLEGASAYSYDDIAPGKTAPVIIGWEISDATSDIEISVADRYHYAKEVIFEQSYTINELIANTQKFMEEYGGIVDEDQALAA